MALNNEEINNLHKQDSQKGLDWDMDFCEADVINANHIINACVASDEHWQQTRGFTMTGTSLQCARFAHRFPGVVPDAFADNPEHYKYLVEQGWERARDAEKTTGRTAAEQLGCLPCLPTGITGVVRSPCM